MGATVQIEINRIPAVDTPTGGRESYHGLLSRLSHQSVTKHFDAYADVDWDRDDYRIDHDDRCWELPDYSMIGSTAWYRAQPAGVRSRIGLHLAATFMKAGAQFENMLQRGLLEFVLTLPNGAPEFRYAYHELIEEGHHSLMFQEFVNRSGLDVPSLPSLTQTGARRMVAMGRAFPELFFIFVLGGEDPIDHVQRTYLRREHVHPLVKRIMQIHITEEARHLSFARSYLRNHVRRLGPLRWKALRVGTPLLLAAMARPMTRVSRHMIREFGIPTEVLAEAYTNNPRHRAATAEALRKTRDLCRELRILTPRTAWLWRRMNLLEPGE